MAKLVFDFLGSPRVASASTNLDIMALAIKNQPGVGQPFLYFDTIPGIPPGTLATWDPAVHPDWAGFGNVVSAVTAENKSMLQAMLAAPPLDALNIV